MYNAQSMDNISSLEIIIEMKPILNENTVIEEYTHEIWGSLGFGWERYEFPK